RVRSSGRRHQLELRLTEGFRPGDAAPSPEAVAVAADERRRLLAMVNALSHEDRLVIASRYFLELSGEETAAALGIAEGTVKSRLSRALARLKVRVEEAAHAWPRTTAGSLGAGHRMARNSSRFMGRCPAKPVGGHAPIARSAQVHPEPLGARGRRRPADRG